MRNKLFKEALDDVSEYTRKFIQRYTDIIDKIHELMLKNNITEDLALKLGKPGTTVAHWIDLRTIAKLEVILREEIIKIN